MPFLAQASSVSVQTDRLFLIALSICVVFLLLVTFFIIYFCIRYSRKRHPEPVDVEGHALLEVIWTVVPLALFLVMFYYGWTNFSTMRHPPPDALAVQVTARQWAWSFKYPNGKQTDQLYVALGRPVKLVTQSLDVIHGLFIPAFRVKIDVVPGKHNYVWFIPWLLGDFDIQCTVICGVSHSAMLSKVHVLPEADFKAWYFSDEAVSRLAPIIPPKGQGSAIVSLLSVKACLACHSVDGSPSVGPTLKGLFKSRQTVFVDGGERVVVADEEFLKRVILRPEDELVKGYPPIMPPSVLSKSELEEVVSYIESLGPR